MVAGCLLVCVFDWFWLVACWFERVGWLIWPFWVLLVCVLVWVFCVSRFVCGLCIIGLVFVGCGCGDCGIAALGCWWLLCRM